MNCFICRDESPILYHICSCNDSLICIDCYNTDLASDMVLCGICRRPYNHKSVRNWKLFFKILLTNFFLYLMMFLVDIVPPIYLYTYNKTNTKSYLYFFGVCIYIGNILTSFLICDSFGSGDDFDKLMKLFYSLKYGFIILMFIYIYFNTVSIDKLKIYTITVGCVVYILPLAIFSLVFYISDFTKFIKSLNRKTLKKQIRIYRILYN